jgi:O-acetyl-ADP-ribose deacetylase (regulator of RNase III)
MPFSTNRIEILQGDITRIKTDAIVNAANSSLMGGGGVDGAIHRAGGPAIPEACKAIVARQGECPAGQAVITTGGNLPATYVIHTVGPVWHGGNRNEAQTLADCYHNSLALAVENNCHTVAFPNISTGVYRFPKEQAAQIAVQTVKQFLTTHPSIEKVLFVCFETENASLIEKELEKS